MKSEEREVLGREQEDVPPLGIGIGIGSIPITANQQTAGLEEKQRRMLGSCLEKLVWEKEDLEPAQQPLSFREQERRKETFRM